MVKRRKLALRLNHTDGARTQTSLNDFAKTCSALQKCLMGVARCLGRDNAEFVVSNLQIGSTLVETEPVRHEDWEISDATIETFHDLEYGRTIDDRIDYFAIKRFEVFCDTITRGVPLDVCGVGLSANFVRNVRALSEPETKSFGSVTGRVEAVNIHEANKFFLYPALPDEKIECRFERNDLTRVLHAIDKRVTVYGLLEYSREKRFPVRATVEDFEVLPSDEELSDLIQTRSTFVEPKEPRFDEWE